MGNTRARYRRILRFAARYIIQTWWYELVLPRIGLRAVAERGRTARLTRIAQRFHALAVSLGGLMIKVGQYLSSRLDVLPPEITKELAGLLSKVGAEGKVLLVDSRDNENLNLASRNNPGVKTVDALGVNVYDILDRPFIVLSEQALGRLVEVLGS